MTYEVDVSKLDINYFKPYVSLNGEDNPLWGYLPGWLLEPSYATQCITGMSLSLHCVGMYVWWDCYSYFSSEKC